MTTQAVEYPRTPLSQRKQGGVNWERLGWQYMRVSGALLVVLIFVHLYSNLISGHGVSQIDYQYVIDNKFSVPFWAIWDALLLVLAMIHGTNGMRTIVNDYVHKPGLRRGLTITLWVTCAVEIALGMAAVVVLWVEPCMAGAVTGGANMCQ